MLESAFDKYVSKYDLTDEKIKLKYNHCYRVMKLSEKYAKKLNFSEEEIELAKIIGLLHDLGRFEQIRVYNTFDDSKSIDHAAYSIEQLFDKNQIVNFTDREEDYEVIKFAINNHNNFILPKVDDERTMKFAKLIRDMDKIDILYLLGYLGELNCKATQDNISEEVLESVRNNESILKKYIQNENDSLVLKFAYVFDIYNDICLPEIKQNIEYFYKQIEGEPIFKEVYKLINKYIDERMN